MSNKMLLALFVVGAVVVGGVALRNQTKEATPVATEQVATDMVETDSVAVLAENNVAPVADNMVVASNSPVAGAAAQDGVAQ